MWVCAMHVSPKLLCAAAATYRSHAAHKLLELDDKLDVFGHRPGGTAVDLAAAPGGFAQVAVERMNRAQRSLSPVAGSAQHGTGSPRRAMPSASQLAAQPTRPPPLHPPSLVIAFDLQQIRPLPGVVSHRCSILNTLRVASLVRQTLAAHPAAAWPSVVLHDGVSTGEGQQGLSATYAQNNMALVAMKIAVSLLTKSPVLTALPPSRGRDAAAAAVAPVFASRGGGTGAREAAVAFRHAACFVTKAMHSRHYNQLLDTARVFFESVDVWKPPSSKAMSRETYIVARRLRPSAVEDFRRITNSCRGADSSGAAATAGLFSLPPGKEDVAPGRQAVWMCHRCEQMRSGCTACARCSEVPLQ